jgi:hypothetical protein
MQRGRRLSIGRACDRWLEIALIAMNSSHGNPEKVGRLSLAEESMRPGRQRLLHKSIVIVIGDHQDARRLGPERESR